MLMNRSRWRYIHIQMQIELIQFFSYFNHARFTEISDGKKLFLTQALELFQPRHIQGSFELAVRGPIPKWGFLVWRLRPSLCTSERQRSLCRSATSAEVDGEL